MSRRPAAADVADGAPPAPPADDLLLAGPAHSVFGAVSPSKPVTAVVRRLRTAIALGLLRNGDRLPREADLVRRLGVTAFSVRAALGILREQGLIVTRAGKHGGSFVSMGTDRRLLTSGELRAMSATELHELGDWREMLASVTAALAARRASVANVARLRAYAAALGAAEDEVQACRAHGRFHVELAAAAQSIRMTHAELALYEELDWLLGLVLAVPQRRAEGAAELAAVADAVADRDADAARAAAERHSAATLQALVKLRLDSLAGAATGADSAGGTSARDVAADLGHALDDLAAGLQDLADKAERALRASADEHDLRARLSRAAMTGLAVSPLELDGLGFMAAPSVVPGAEYWVGWWQLTPDGVVADDRHILDPERDDFYDYVGHEYFSVPRDTGRLAAEGPYVDYGGTNDYIVTFAMPVRRDGRFVGIAAADVAVAALERRLAPRLAAAAEPCVVVNAEGRVVVTNVAVQRVGHVLPESTRPRWAPVGPVGWSLVRWGGAA